MAIGDVAKELFGFSDKTWTMEVIPEDQQLYKGTKEFQGQFIAQNLEETVGSFLGETTTVNKEIPAIQYVRGETEFVRFQTRLFSDDSSFFVGPRIESFKKFAKRDDGLRRPPIINFRVGTEISFRCYVNGIRVRYDEIRSDGSLRGAVFDVELKKVDATTFSELSASTASNIKIAAGIITGLAGIGAQIDKQIVIPGGSLHTTGRIHVVKQGETFESIARQEYGDAHYGDVLRRAFPEKVPLKPGDKIPLVVKAEIEQIKVTQQSIPLRDTQTNKNLLEEKLASRNRPRNIFV